MVKYRKKPVVVEAFRWLEDVVPQWFRDLAGNNHIYVNVGTLVIPTREGRMTVNRGDWIILGVEGEIYPCQDSIFRATYEAVEENGAPMPDAPERPTQEMIETAMRAARLAANPQWWWLADEIDALRAELAIVTAARDAALADCRILVAQINRLVDDAHSSGLVLQATVGDYAFDALARHGGGA